MSKGGMIIEDIVGPLLQQVADAKCKLTAQCSGSIGGSSTHNGFSGVDGLLQEIEKIAKLIVDAFRRQEVWVKEVENEINIIAKDLDIILEDNGNETSITSLREHVYGSFFTLRYKLSNVGELGHRPLIITLPFPTVLPFIPDSPTQQQFEVTEKYQELDPRLKRCLLTLAIFPQDSIIEKRLLIHWWVGEEIVRPTIDLTAEEVGESCIEGLISKGLIRGVYRRHCSQCKHLKVEQWIRDKVITLAKENGAFSFNDSLELIEDLTSSPRACLKESPQQGTSKLPATHSDFRGEEFMTCFNVDRHNLRFEHGRFTAMKNAAVMQLGRWQISPRHHIEAASNEFLEWLADFNKLRYLSLRGISNITKLPISIDKLTSLIILDLRACHNLENLPDGITMLTKLTYLDVSECYLLDHMPKKLSSLTELRVLKGFVIGNSTSSDQCRLWELAGLEKLWKLSIRIGCDSAATKKEFHELNRFRALRSLTITWGAIASTPSSGARKVLPGKSTARINLSPPPDLKKLDLRCFPGNRAPEWLTGEKFHNLQKLYIRGGRFRRLGVGTKFNSVQVLRLRYLPDFRMEETNLRKVFPSLRILEVWNCGKLQSRSRKYETSHND